MTYEFILQAHLITIKNFSIMGLDVYLYRYENKSETDRKEELYEQETEKNWNLVGEYDSLTDEMKKSIRDKNKEFALSIGLDDSGECPNKECIQFDSAIDKEHYFKVGYFRSSYNESGINSILSNLDVPGLYEIFDVNDRYKFQPDWDEANKKVSESISLLESKGNYRVFHVEANMFNGTNGLPTDSKEAMDLFLRELAGKVDGEGFDCYSNNKGWFSLKEPLEVFAILPGMYSLFGERPTSYVVTKGSNEWYINALKIVKETIEWVIAQPDREQYWLHWSS